jgi:Uma2 family endonuclease
MANVAHNLSIEGERLRLPANVFELDGFREWVTDDDFPENVRATFVRGEILLEMSPEAIESHNKVKTEVTITLGHLVRSEDLGEVYCDGALLTNEDAEISTEPDLTFASWKCLESGRLTKTPKANRPQDSVEIVGTPDLIVEIVSDSSVRKDLVLLRDGYLRARVPEYWMIDARGDTLGFEILCLKGKRYVAADPAGKPQRSRIFRRSFTLKRKKNRIGDWSYVLAAK